MKYYLVIIVLGTVLWLVVTGVAHLTNKPVHEVAAIYALSGVVVLMVEILRRPS